VSSSDEAGRSYTAEEALARLAAGNERFVHGQARFPTVQKEVLAELAKGQRPYATIIGCSDSRVPPELVFDASFGELFIVRIAGNVISPEVMGSLQYPSRASGSGMSSRCAVSGLCGSTVMAFISSYPRVGR